MDTKTKLILEILDNSCPTIVLEKGGPRRDGMVAIYRIESHCVAWEIKARTIVTVDEHGHYHTDYEILETKEEPIS